MSEKVILIATHFDDNLEIATMPWAVGTAALANARLENSSAMDRMVSSGNAKTSTPAIFASRNRMLASLPEISVSDTKRPPKMYSLTWMHPRMWSW